MLRQSTPPSPPRLAIIVPVLNEIDGARALTEHLAIWQQRGAEIIVVDGGSDDKSDIVIRERGFHVIRSERGRAVQMNTGARATTSTHLLFLHADTRLPPQADTLVREHLSSSQAAWGRFDVQIEGHSSLLPVVSRLMSLRSRLTGIATGDQAIFVTRELFEQVGGFPVQPLMEDVEISKRLKLMAPPRCLRDKVVTSGRRWDERGSWQTILLMWRLRWAYWRGVPAEQLAFRYR